MIDFSGIASKYGLRALAVIGSRARGDFTRYSDIDLIGLSDRCTFMRFSEDGLIVELHIAEKVADWKAKPSWWYALDYLDMKIDDGSLANLPQLLELWRSGYRSPVIDIERNRDWLESAARKIKGAPSEISLSFLLSTALWEILAGVFISSDMPVPANSDMLRIVPEMIGVTRFEQLLVGSLTERRDTTLGLCQEIIAAHTTRLKRMPHSDSSCG